MGKKKKKKSTPKKKKILAKKPAKKKKKAWWKYAIIGAIVLVIGYLGIQAWLTFDSIWDTNRTGQSPFLKLLGDVEAGELQGEGDGRINILLLGIPGGNHSGRDLSDTNIVASIDPINHKVAMLSLPRDMWVTIPGNGSCKLNAVHAYGEMSGEKDGGPNLSKTTISEIIDLPIHYYVQVDFLGLIKLIDAIGGVDVDVEYDIYDPYFPDKYSSGYEPYSISAGEHHLNGNEALKYARSRYTTSDFDRAGRQQQIITAAKKKMAKDNIIVNSSRILRIIKAARNHFKTDLTFNEIKRLANILDQVNSDELISRVLDNSAEGLLVSDSINGASVLKPRSGDWTEIQSLAHSIFTEPYLEQEAAKIKVLNGTTTPGIATQASEVLGDLGYNITKVDDAKKSNYKETLIIDYSDGDKPHTIDLLEKRIPRAKLMKDGISKNGADIVIILGKDFKVNDLYR